MSDVLQEPSCKNRDHLLHSGGSLLFDLTTTERCITETTDFRSVEFHLQPNLNAEIDPPQT